MASGKVIHNWHLKETAGPGTRQRPTDFSRRVRLPRLWPFTWNLELATWNCRCGRGYPSLPASFRRRRAAEGRVRRALANCRAVFSPKRAFRRSRWW